MNTDPRATAREASVEHIVIATFQEASAAEQGMAELHRLHNAGTLHVGAAALMQRRPDGSWTSKKKIEHLTFKGAVAGTLVGALLGALVSPVAALLGGTLGLVGGELVDVVEDETRELILATMVRHVPPGTTAIVADVEEEAGDTLDVAMGRLGGQVKRWRRSEVLAAMGAVDEAEPGEGTTRTREAGLRRVQQGDRDDTA
jgi:uncharacterized membrane protein